MLDIRDMSKKDKLFYFLEGMKPWARIELHRQRVQNLSTAQATAECLTDYAGDDIASSKRHGGEGNSGKSFKKGKPKSGGADSKSSTLKEVSSSQGFNTPNEKGKSKISCYLCGGSHRVSECQHKGLLNALQASASGKELESEEEENNAPRVVSVRLVSTLEKQAKAPKVTRAKGLMFVDLRINGKSTRAMVDTGATHTFVSQLEVWRLNLSLEKDTGRMKAVNSVTQPTMGVAKQVAVKLGQWEGHANFTVVPLDDFLVILGMEFLRGTRAVLMPSTGSLCLMGDHSCMVQVVATKGDDGKSLSAIQLNEGLGQGE
ncbi:uncharacterized protein LOC131152113 [Malania oleifera]|uniref:uncharacterized protein LOC131152113 n=1 Tax=Malania oleifera TaxID=397392 RepID=UPI0025AE06E3|nr:uncharacterized protein LOC131152113 [Malania oleifera]